MFDSFVYFLCAECEEISDVDVIPTSSVPPGAMDALQAAGGKLNSETIRITYTLPEPTYVAEVKIIVEGFQSATVKVGNAAIVRTFKIIEIGFDLI